MQPLDFSYNLRQGFYVNITTVGIDGKCRDAVGGLRVYSWDDMLKFIKSFEFDKGDDSNMPMHVHAKRHLFLSGLKETDNNCPFYSIDLTDTSDRKQRKSHVINFWAVQEKIPTFAELKKSSVFCINMHGCEKCEHETCLFSMDSRLDKKLAVVDYTTPAKIRLLNNNNIVIKQDTGEQLYKERQQVPTQLVDFFNSNTKLHLNQPWITINR